jgi:hypothetical protein
MPKRKYIVEKRTVNYNAGRENDFSEWSIVGETMAVSEEQAIRNVTYNEGVKSYSSLSHDIGNDEELNTEYRARTEKIPDYIHNLDTVLSTYDTWKIDEVFNLFPELKEKY